MSKQNIVWIFLLLSWIVSLIPISIFGNNALGLIIFCLFVLIYLITFVLIIRQCFRQWVKGLLALLLFPTCLFLALGYFLARQDYRNKRPILSPQGMEVTTNLNPEFREYLQSKSRWSSIKTSFFQMQSDQLYQYFIRKAIKDDGFTGAHYTGRFPEASEAKTLLQKHGTVIAAIKSDSVIVFKTDTAIQTMRLDKGAIEEPIYLNTDSVLCYQGIPGLLIVATRRFTSDTRKFNEPRESWYMNEILMLDTKRNELFCVYKN